MLDGLNFLQFVLGVFGGTISAIVTLFVFHYIVSGSVYFSDKICVTRAFSSSRQSYSVKLKKTGIVDLVEVGTTCRLIIRDIYLSEPSVKYYFDIPCTFPRSLIFKRDTRIIHLKVHESRLADLESTVPKMAEVVGKGIPELGYRIEDFFMAYPDVAIKVYVLGHDRFTGTKKLFESKLYYFHDIREGSWEPDSLQLNLAE